MSFTDQGPEDAPLFQELEGPVASPFVVVGGTRPSLTAGGLAGAARGGVDEGFTADELISMVPAHSVRAGAVPGNRVIPLPPGVLRASLGAGQPAILLSQLHQACPELFLAPSSLDDDLVIALPPHKVQRLVARFEAGGASAAVPPPLPIPPGLAVDPSAAAQDFDPRELTEGADPVFASLPSKVKLPPPRRRFEEMQGDFRPMIEPSAAQAGTFSQSAAAPEPGHSDGPVFGSVTPPRSEPLAMPSAPASPFQISSALPVGQPGPGGGFPKRFESPFAIVAPGEVPAVLEAPFARHPLASLEPSSPPPPTAPIPAPVAPQPEPPPTVSLRLSTLLAGQSADALGFAPEKVPPGVRVTLATAPLLAQLASGRVRVRLEEVVAGLDPKFRPAFERAQPGLEVPVPLRELFDNLPEAVPPAPPAPPVASLFETPFSIRAEEDHPLTAATSPFHVVPAPPSTHHASPVSPGAISPATPPEPLAPPALPATVAPAPPATVAPAPPAAIAPAPHASFPAAAPSPVPAFTEYAPSPSAAAPAPPPAIERAAPPAMALEPQEPSPAVRSPFLLVPDVPTAPPPHAAAPPPILPAPLPPPLVATPPPPTPPPPVASLPPPAVLPDAEVALAVPPAQVPLPSIPNPFALAPGAGLGLDLPMMPFDEDPVPLESLREEPSVYQPGHPAAAVKAPAAADIQAVDLRPETPAPSTSTPPHPPFVRPLDQPPAVQPAAAQPPAIQPAVDQPAAPCLTPAASLADTARLAAPEADAAVPPSTHGAEPAPTPEPPVGAVQPAATEPRPPVFRLALSEQEPIPPSAMAELPPAAVEPLASPPFAAWRSEVPEPAQPPAQPLPVLAGPLPPGGAAPADPEPPAPSPFLAAAAFELPPLPAELSAPATVAETAPAAVDAPPTAEAADSDAAVTAQPASATAVAATSSAGEPSPAAEDDRAAFASVFVPSALALRSDGTPPLREVDALPSIALAKLPPIEELPPPEPRVPASVPPPQGTPPAIATTSGTAPEPAAALEDLSFGCIDDPSQLALRALLGTGRTLTPQDVVDAVARFDGLAASLLLGPHTRLHTSASPDETEDVRHFRQRAEALYEKTASLVRELDPGTREHNFTLRTGKGVVSFFAVGDTCLAVLHAEPAFHPGVREKLTLITRSLSEMPVA